MGNICCGNKGNNNNNNNNNSGTNNGVGMGNGVRNSMPANNQKNYVKMVDQDNKMAGMGNTNLGNAGNDADANKQRNPSTMHDFIILNDRAYSLSVAGKQKPAEQMYRQALEGLQALQAYDQVGICTGNLAVCLKRQRRFDEAEVLFKEALKLTEEYLGSSSPKVSDVSYNLHSMYKTQKRYAEAVTYLRKSIEIDERQYGPAHKEVLRSKSELEQLEQLASQSSSTAPPN